VTLHPLVDDVVRPMNGRKEPRLTDEELLSVCEKAQHFAGNDAVAAELLAVAKKLHDAGASDARDQVVIVAAVVLEDMELNGALCRKLYAGKRVMADVMGHPKTERPDPHAVTDPRKSVLRARLASMSGATVGSLASQDADTGAGGEPSRPRVKREE
jgi:hypothetical protein